MEGGRRGWGKTVEVSSRLMPKAELYLALDKAFSFLYVGVHDFLDNDTWHYCVPLNDTFNITLITSNYRIHLAHFLIEFIIFPVRLTFPRITIKRRRQ